VTDHQFKASCPDSAGGFKSAALDRARLLLLE
jgi:hypothetical protein